MDENHNCSEGFEIFLTFFKRFLKEIPKNAIILSYFSENLTNSALIFRAFWRKTKIVWKFWENFEIFDKNSIGKLNLNDFLESFLLKIEPSEITSFFDNNFFHFEEGDVSCRPWRRLCLLISYRFVFSRSWQSLIKSMLKPGMVTPSFQRDFRENSLSP